MTRFCCQSCRVRFTPASAMAFTCCPECGDPLEAAESAALTIGYRLLDIHDLESPLPYALEASAPVPPEIHT